MKTLFLLTFVLFPATIQAFETGGIQRNDLKDTSRISSIISGFEFSGNTSSLGRYSTVSSQPSYNAYLSYFTKSGFNFGFTPLYIGNSDTTFTKFTWEYDFNAGYNLTLYKNISLSAFYNHSFFSKNSNSLQTLYTDMIQLGMEYDYKDLYFKADGYYAQGNTSEWMNSFQLGGNLSFDEVLFRNSQLTIGADLTLMFGNQKYYSEYAYKTYYYLYNLSQKFPLMTVNDVYLRMEKHPRLWNLFVNYPDLYANFKKLDRNLVLSDLFKPTYQYNLSSVTLEMPLDYTIGNTTLSIAYTVCIPTYAPSYLDLSPVQYFSAGISYNFSW